MTIIYFLFSPIISFSVFPRLAFPAFFPLKISPGRFSVYCPQFTSSIVYSPSVYVSSSLSFCSASSPFFIYIYIAACPITFMFFISFITSFSLFSSFSVPSSPSWKYVCHASTAPSIFLFISFSSSLFL